MTSITIDRRDGLSSSTAIKGPCRVATTVNIALSGLQTVDGVVLVDDDRVLVKDQTDQSENGLYVADTGPWRRSKDFSGNRDVVQGTQVWVNSGATGGGFWYIVTSPNPIVIDQSDITFIIQPLAQPEWYGLIGDGIADDSVAFQSLVTAFNGKTIAIDGLNIRITSEITLPSLGLTLKGRGVITYEGTGNLFKAGTRVKTTFNFTATAGQTVFTCAYVPTDPYVEAFVGGVKAVQAIGVDAFTTIRDGTSVIVTFFTGRTLGQAIRIECERFDSSTGLDPFGAVHIGTGVSIKTTQANEGRAFAVGWIETGYERRQFPRFVFEAGAQIMGVDGTRGFKNAMWLNGLCNGQLQGYIFGIGANDPAGNEIKARTCPYAVYLTGELTPSDLKFYGGMMGWYDIGVGIIGNTFEGVHCHGYTWLLCGKAFQWVAPAVDYGLLLIMNGCHANCYTGIVETYSVGSVYISDNDFFRDGTGAATFFTFIDLKGCFGGAIHDNQIQSYKIGGQDVGVAMSNGGSLVRVHDNEFMASDTTGLFIGTVIYNTAHHNVIGPNSYINIGVAVDVQSGAQANGLLTYGDTFQTPAVTAYARYIDNGSNTYFDKKWWIGKVGVNTALATSTFVDWFPLEVTDPDSISSGGLANSPAWARKVEIEAVFTFAANATGNRWARISKGGVEMIGMQQTVPAAPSGETVIMLKGEVDCVGGEAFVPTVWQNSGGSLNLLANRSYIKILFK